MSERGAEGQLLRRQGIIAALERRDGLAPVSARAARATDAEARRLEAVAIIEAHDSKHGTVTHIDPDADASSLAIASRIVEAMNAADSAESNRDRANALRDLAAMIRIAADADAPNAESFLNWLALSAAVLEAAHAVEVGGVQSARAFVSRISALADSCVESIDGESVAYGADGRGGEFSAGGALVAALVVAVAAVAVAVFIG